MLYIYKVIMIERCGRNFPTITRTLFQTVRVLIPSFYLIKK